MCPASAGLRERGKKITALRGQGWCIRRDVNPVGGGKEGEKPAPDGCVLVAITDKAHTSNFRVDVPFTWEWIPNTQIP